MLPDGEKWHPQTQAWWTVWRKSAQARTFEATDWQFLLDTALMHHQMWAKGRWDFASEVRLRVAKFGATVADRQSLKMEIERAEKAPPVPAATEGNVTDISSRRRRLAG